MRLKFHGKRVQPESGVPRLKKILLALFAMACFTSSPFSVPADENLAPKAASELSAPKEETAPAPEAMSEKDILNSPNLVNYTSNSEEDIKTILEAIADICNVSIVPAPDLNKKIKISLKNVPLKDALDAIATVSNVSWKVKGSIIYIESQKKLELKIIPLKYSPAPEIREKVIEPLKSEQGSVLVDQRSNKLIIRDLPDRLEIMEKVIQDLDKAPHQVTINAKIVDITVSDAESLGLSLQGKQYNGAPNDGSQITKDNSGHVSRGFTTADTTLTNADGTTTTLSPGIGRTTNYNSYKGTSNSLGADLRQNDAATSTFSYDYNSFKNDEHTITDVTSLGTLTSSVLNAALSNIVNMKLDALITKGKTLLLASPTITTLNNQTASIIIGEKVGIKEQTQTTTGTTETIRFQDVGTKLEVTPQINDDGYITMEIKPEISEVSSFTSQDNVRFTTNEARTTVRVKDGQTVIIGGLIKNKEGMNRLRVPFLSRIPLIGFLFRSRYDTGDQTELVVFLSPKILKVETDPGEKKIAESEETKRNEEAKAKEDQLMNEFGQKYNKWGDPLHKEIGEAKTLAETLYTDALHLERKARRFGGERGAKIYPMAIEKYKLLIETYPDYENTPLAIYNLALIQNELKNKEEAIALLDKILEKYPDHKIYKKASKMKAKLKPY